MIINYPSYKWAGDLSKRKTTTAIILHHRAGNGDAMSIHTQHVNQKWAGIGYHFYIRKDGSVYAGRPIDTTGAHAGNNNYYSIGLCFEGDYQKELNMPQKQINAGQELVSYIQSRYGNKLTVKRHSDVNNTDCPGQYFPFTKISAGIPKSTPNNISSDILTWQTAVKKDGAKVNLSGKWDSLSLSAANKYVVKRRTIHRYPNTTKFVQKKLGTTQDGKCGPATKRAIINYQKAHSLTADGSCGPVTIKSMLGI